MQTSILGNGYTKMQAVQVLVQPPSLLHHQWQRKLQAPRVGSPGWQVSIVNSMDIKAAAATLLAAWTAAETPGE